MRPSISRISTAFAANFGLASGAFWSQGDFNYDGVVDLQDFNRLAENFGLSAARSDVSPQGCKAPAAAMPEPRCNGTGCAAAVRRRRRFSLVVRSPAR
jgi:hypothetical protein